MIVDPRVALAVLAFATPPAVLAQPGRPRADVAPGVERVTARPGDTVKVSLTVRLPEDVHVQAHEPRDASLIATVLTVEAPPGVTVDAVAYPVPTELRQAGRTDTLDVLGPAFEIGVRLTVAATAAQGDLAVPAVLRYQACNDRVCFAPARATAAWRLEVIR